MAKKEYDNSGELNAFLDKGSEFEGKLVFQGSVRIDGKFKGDIISNDYLIVGETGIVEGTINVGNATISGTVNGKLQIKNKLELLSTGKIDGEIFTKILSISEGAKFNGNCTMNSNKVAENSKEKHEK